MSPLLRGAKNIGKNIKTEMKHGKGKAQSIAIALNVAGKSKEGSKKEQKGDKGKERKVEKKEYKKKR